MSEKIDDINKMTGAQKAAAFMLAIGEDSGRQIWEMLSDDEVKELSQHMSNLGSVSADVIEELFVEFASQVSSVGNLNGSFESTERLLGKILPPDRVGQIMDEIRGPALYCYQFLCQNYN